MLERNIRFHLRNDFYYNGFAVHITDEHKDGSRSIATMMTLEDIQPGTAAPREPLFVLSDHEAQALMDELYRAGVRPRDAKGTAGQLEAMKEHLTDMRKLVFEQPVVEVVTHDRRATDKKPRANRGAGVIV